MDSLLFTVLSILTSCFAAPDQHVVLLPAAGLMIGIGALLIPSKARCHPLMASSHWLCLALLLWHVTCYIATAVATAHVAIPSLAQSLGLLTFKQGSSAVAYFLAQLAVAMMLAALSRADLYMNDPEHAPSYDPTLPTAVEPLGPLPTLHDSIANYWHHGRRLSLSRDHSKHQADTGGPNGSTGGADSAAETRSAQGGEGGLAPIRTRVGQAAPSGQRPASLVSCKLTHHSYYTHCGLGACHERGAMQSILLKMGIC